MLKAMRTGAQSFIVKLVLFGLLLMAMAGLALMDVQGMFRAGVSDTTVARIGGDKITAANFERMVSTALRDKNMPQNVGVALGVPQQVLTQEINSRVFSKAARDIGFIPDDAAAAKSIKSLLAPYVKQGMTEKEALARFLASTGLSEDGLVATVKSQAATDTLLKLVTSGAHAPQQLVEDTAKYRHEQRRGEYFTLTAADAGKVDQPSDAALKDYYKTIAAQFALPEYRGLQVLLLDRKSLGIEQKTDEASLKKYYDEHKADYAAPETRTVSQVVAGDEGAAKAVYAAAKTGDLQKAAAANKANYVKAQTFSEKDIPVELKDAAFKGAAGAVLPPVKSPLGWHVMRVEKISPGSVKSFESVRASIEKDTADDKTSAQLYDQANRIDDLLAGGMTLDEVAKQYSLKPVTIDKVDAQGNDPGKKKAGGDLPAFTKVVDEAFRIGKGEASPLIEGPGDKFLVVAVKDVYPSENRPFDSVKDAVLASWKQKETAGLLDKTSAKITERLKSGETFDKIAASFGKTSSATGFLARTADASKEGLDKAFIPALFSLEKTGDATAAAGEGRIAVLRLAARRIDMPAAQSKEDAASLAASLDRSLQNGILDEYRAVLLSKYDVTINDKLLREMFKPKENEEN